MDYKKITKEDTWQAFQLHVMSGISMDEALGVSTANRRQFFEDSLASAYLSLALTIMVQQGASLYAACKEMTLVLWDDPEARPEYMEIVEHLSILNKEAPSPKALLTKLKKFAADNNTPIPELNGSDS